MSKRCHFLKIPAITVVSVSLNYYYFLLQSCGTQQKLSDFVSGLDSTGDTILDEAAKALRLLHVQVVLHFKFTPYWRRNTNNPEHRNRTGAFDVRNRWAKLQ